MLATCEAAARFRFYARLRGLAYSAARAGDDDDLVFDSRHEVLLSTFCFPLSFFLSARLSLGIIAPGVYLPNTL